MKAASASRIAASSTPSSVATAMAASALRTLCRPGRFSSTCSAGSTTSRSRRCTVKRMRVPSACTSWAHTCASGLSP
ncbi:Uncharacterised protein [Bordetella pertussis]|nr:Uncharacterised protein [Bordetella pertussis]